LPSWKAILLPYFLKEELAAGTLVPSVCRAAFNILLTNKKGKVRFEVFTVVAMKNAVC
jgi:hypothetical protein